jgi:nitrogen fixation/metabolism regulation signal transduction histidine kinase
LERDIKQRYGETEVLSIEENGSALEYILQKLSAIYQTDINIYDNQGFLLASSRAKLFNIGLLSEQINPSALFELNQFRKSEYIHEETIGNLRFLSAYVPFFNNEGNRIAFINLQHFGQQKGVEFQIKQFLESAINVAILLFALSVLFALFVSRWVTSPLRILKESFSKVQLGAFNEPITYTANDEIGALVVDYNNKLNDLAETSQKLAKSERESAWREMAKQVAHEIKNPLTPMKLNLQQLQRVYDPSTPLPKEKITQITNSLIEQIDTLAKIANEFSNFAQLPKPVIEKIDLSTLLENVIVFFKQEEHHTIQLNIQADNPIINGDKDLLLRVFNNLISNAIQSIPTDRQGLIQLLVEREDNNINIEIKDNGCGIPTTIQSSIFEPYFTTKSTGTGLGLAMCKQIIDQHHGNILFTTEENIGTTFSILLPIVIDL